MGSAALYLRKDNSLYLDDNPKSNIRGVGFSTVLFNNKEWKTLKIHCNDNNIIQLDLNNLFKR